MNQSADLSAFILAGGKSTRMGTDKAFVVLDGSPLLVHALEIAREVAANVSIVGDPSKFTPFAPTIADIFPNCGPLGGIHAALRASQNELNLMLAVDMPLVSPELLQFLIARARRAPSATATVPRFGGGWQPLCAIYRREFADRAEAALRKRRYKIDALFDPARTEVVTEEELQAAGFSAGLFRNLNTPGDLAAACE